jgi:manganese transport protein
MRTDSGRHDVRAVIEGDLGTYLSEMGPSWVAGAVAAGPATIASEP